MLNKTVYKHIIHRANEIIDKNLNKNILLDAPTLFDANLDKICDATLCITSDYINKIDRIMTRDNIDHENAILRLKNQKTDEEFKSLCTFTIENNGDKKELCEKIRNIILKVENSRI